jgi:hypothetical protein
MGQIITRPGTGTGGAAAFATNRATATAAVVNSTTVPTSGGLTLPAQTLAAGTSWRIRASGAFTAANSAVVRSAEFALSWGGTLSAAVGVIVLASVAQSTGWQLELLLSAVSGTAANLAGFFINQIGSATLVNNLRIGSTLDSPLPAGAQTIDLQFFMSVVVAGDQWIIDQATIERLT